jgi:hypothetical protein
MKLLLAVMQAALLVLPAEGRAEENTLLLDLRGRWKFAIGDDMRRAEPKFGDAPWNEIFVPAAWEDEGYPGYDGYGWYRKHFSAPREWQDKDLVLDMGTIDDVDEVYVNGHFIGFSGSFPPHYITAYSATRIYRLPPQYLNFDGDNVVAVRVYDSQMAGGILRGRIGVYAQAGVLRSDLRLPDEWSFATGDDKSRLEPDFDDHQWKKVLVPAWWETQGFKEYDGFAWYRVKFLVPSSLAGQRLLLMLGKVDDLDETYLNGERIGTTGGINTPQGRSEMSDEYLKVRSYPIPSGLLRFDQENVLAVRVYDAMLHGGIYAGPIGIVTREHYAAWRKTQQDGRNDFWDAVRSIFR